MQTGAQAVTEAFAKVTSGSAQDVEIALPAISRRSPLASWKMLVKAIFYFYHDARLLSELMKVGIKCLEDTLSTVLRRPIQGGYIVVVQTNGRSGSYNPHLHIIMTSGGLAPSRRGGQYWVKLKYLPYEILHKKWQYHLFGMLKEQVGTKEMRAKIDELYRKYPKGLVANIQKGQVPKRVRDLAKYLASYALNKHGIPNYDTVALLSNFLTKMPNLNSYRSYVIQFQNFIDTHLFYDP